MRRLSTGQYAKILGISKQAVLYRISRKLYLPGVLLIETVAGRYILHIDINKLNKRYKNKSGRIDCRTAK